MKKYTKEQIKQLRFKNYYKTLNRQEKITWFGSYVFIIFGMLFLGKDQDLSSVQFLGMVVYGLGWMLYGYMTYGNVLWEKEIKGGFDNGKLDK